MKKIFLIPLLFIGSFTIAANDFPAFPMTIHGNIKIWSNDLDWWTLKVYNSSNQELSSYSIIQPGKYWSNNVSIQPLLLNQFDWNLSFKVSYNWKNYIVDSIDDSNKWVWCPSKSSITFTSENCRYDITLKLEQTTSTNTSWSSYSSWSWRRSSSSTSSNNKSSNDVSSTSEKKDNIENIMEKIKEIINSEEKVKKNENDTKNTTNNTNSIDKKQTNYIFMQWNPKEVLENWFTREQTNAYNFAYANWITSINDIKRANMNLYVTRAAMAKMLSNYAINYLGKEPDTSKVPYFLDISDQVNNQYDNWITLAYQLWLMWIWSNKFRPYDPVTRAEFWTALSRLLYWIKDWNDKYYTTHLSKLKLEWIISNDTPDLKEKKWNIMLMLMRSAK